MGTRATFTLLALMLAGWFLAFGLANRHIQATALAVETAPWPGEACAPGLQPACGE